MRFFATIPLSRASSAVHPIRVCILPDRNSNEMLNAGAVLFVSDGGSFRLPVFVELSLGYLFHLRLNQLVQLRGERTHFSGGLGTRVGKRDWHDFLDTARCRSHDQYPVCKVNRLSQVVRHKHDGLSSFLPDALQLFVQ